MRRMPSRRGVALLAALWLVVVIASVALQFALTAHERRMIGLTASDRMRDRAVNAGALSTVLARLDFDLRNRASGQVSAAALRSSDPWLGADSIYSGTVQIGKRTVDVVVTDLGARLNINSLAETELKTFLAFVLTDYARADELAQSIMDWRDTDTLARVSGGERAEYIKDGLLMLPANAPFRDVDDLIYVRGMTPEILATVKPYLSTFGSRVNVNTAPEAVLRALPGMTDAVLVNILSMRSSGRRIESLSSVMLAAERSRPTRGGQGGAMSRAEQQLAGRAGVETRDLHLTFFTRDTLTSQPSRLTAVVQRSGNNTATLQWQQW